jgi:hypothetical protein
MVWQNWTATRRFCSIMSIRDMHWNGMRVNPNSGTNEREESWTHPGLSAFGRVNGCLAFQGFQRLAGNAVSLCHVFHADKAGSTKHCSHFPIYGKNKVYSACFVFCAFLYL